MTASQWGIKFPFCVECKSTLRKHQARSLCTKCYPQKILKKLCSKCNKINVLSRRINEENICGVCNKKLFCPPKKRTCTICNKIKIIDLIKEEKDICRECNKKYFYIQPTKICISCKEDKKIDGYFEGNPYCPICYRLNIYRKPKYDCGRCKKYRKTSAIINGERICHTCYKKDHKERYWLHNQKRKESDKIELEEDTIKEIFQRNKECVYCQSREKLTLDHIIPLSKGGKTMKENLVIACNKCNSSKNKSEVEIWCKRKGLELPEIIEKQLLAQYL